MHRFTLLSHPLSPFIPSLQWPRPELLLMWAVLPIIAAQGSSECRGRGQAVGWGMCLSTAVKTSGLGP